MHNRMFAAIDVGSYELNLKIVEFIDKQMRIIENVRYPLDLGTDSYAKRKISADKVSELIRILKEFAGIMKSYKVSAYKAYGTSAIREVRNKKILIDQIEQRTNIKIDVLSNSEQRFLNYKSVASKGKDFLKTIEKGTAILDIGGGSIQISLFNNGKLDISQNMDIGAIRLLGHLKSFEVKSSRYEEILEEMVSSQLTVFARLYLQNRKIENLIIVDDYLAPLVWHKTRESDKKGFMEIKEFFNFINSIKGADRGCNDIAYNQDIENRELVEVVTALAKETIEITGAKQIWAPGATLTDGIAYEYGEKKRLISFHHDFEEDIIAFARFISTRYMGDENRYRTLEDISLKVFDAMKSVHGLKERDRLLLRMAAILHDCGKYISMQHMSTCSYDIIISTEIIGLSHDEREILANVVKHNHAYLDFDVDKSGIMLKDGEAYMKTAKLTAILRLANGMDKSKKHKFTDIKATLKDNILNINVYTNKDITLEKGFFAKRADFFEEIYHVRPIINQIAKL